MGGVRLRPRGHVLREDGFGSGAAARPNARHGRSTSTPGNFSGHMGEQTLRKTKQYLAVNLDHWQQHGYGLWIVRDADGIFAGRAGIRHLTIEKKDEIELAYSLMPTFWGRGLAPEIATALSKIAFERLDIPEIVAFTLSDNWASQRVREKVGFQFERTLTFQRLPCVLYRITANSRLP
jgi:RimJ/RimL family protein N-acetyltransferase